MEQYKYIVCALGYDADDEATDTEIFIEDFGTAEKAIEYAKKIKSISDIEELIFENIHLDEGEYLEIRVEKCIEHEAEDETDPEEGYDECIDVLWEDAIYQEKN